MENDINLQLQAWMFEVADNRCKKSFAHLFQHFASKVKYMTLKQLHNDAVAMEVTQEVLTQVWRKAHLYHPEKGAVTTWVYTITRNVCFDYLRKIQNKPEVLLGEDIWPLVEAEADASSEFVDHLKNKKLDRQIEALPVNQKEVIIGLFFHDLSQEQLARNLDIPLGTVKSRLRLALNKLRGVMGDDND